MGLVHGTGSLGDCVLLGECDSDEVIGEPSELLEKISFSTLFIFVLDVISSDMEVICVELHESITSKSSSPSKGSEVESSIVAIGIGKKKILLLDGD